MTHKAKDCVDRPRKIGAKFTGKDIQPDEIVKTVELDWDGKRDRWNGFQPDMYKKVWPITLSSHSEGDGRI
jgi:pre-mRNA-processing factor SLU7